MKKIFTKLSVVLLLAAAVVSCTESTELDQPTIDDSQIEVQPDTVPVVSLDDLTDGNLDIEPSTLLSTIVLSSSNEWELTISGSEDGSEPQPEWISIESDTTDGDATLSITTERNYTLSDRVAYITLASQNNSSYLLDYSFTITQKASEEIFTLLDASVEDDTVDLTTGDALSLGFDKFGGICAVTITTNLGWEIEVTGEDDWFTIADAASDGAAVTEGGQIDVLTSTTLYIIVGEASDEGASTISIIDTRDGEALEAVAITQDADFKFASETPLSVTNDADGLIVIWDLLAGTSTYDITITYADSSTSQITGISGTTASYDLSDYDFAQSGYVSFSIAANHETMDPAQSNVVEGIHTHFANETGDGASESTPYIISSLRHLKNIDSYGDMGAYYKQTADIDFTDSSDDGSCLVGVSAENMFTGHYTAANGSGGKYKMMNRYFANGDTDAAPSNVFYESGVFGYLGQGAVVEDLIVENFYLHLGMATGWYAADYGFNAPSYSLLIAHAVGATIQNVEITGSEIDIHKGFGTKGVSFDVVNKIAVSQLVARGYGVSINSTYPGLATTHNTLIKDCSITKSGDVGKILSADQTTATTGYSALGSVLGVGLGYVEVNGCTSNIEIGDKGTCGTGGIGGYGGTYIDCHFTGNISKAPIYVGGIVGYYEVSTAENIVSCCSSSGTISWSTFFGNYIGIMGGIVGRVENLYTPGATALIDQCHSSMTITNDGRSDCNAAFGGILGGISNAATTLTVSNCYFEGSLELSSTSTVVKGSFHTAAGIVGEFVGTSNSETQFMNIENCYSVGDIVGAHTGSYSFIQATVLGLATTSWLANADVSASTLSDGKTIKNCFGLDTSMASSQTGVAIICSDYVGALTDESTGNGIKTAAELKTASTFAEYDTSIWSITNGSYPTLINNPAR